MSHVLVRCPYTGFNVQHRLDVTKNLALHLQGAPLGASRITPANRGVSMQNYADHANIARYRKPIAIAIAKGDPARDEGRYQVLLQLLADEEAKQEKPLEE